MLVVAATEVSGGRELAGGRGLGVFRPVVLRSGLSVPLNQSEALVLVKSSPELKRPCGQMEPGNNKTQILFCSERLFIYLSSTDYYQHILLLDVCL